MKITYTLERKISKTSAMHIQHNIKSAIVTFFSYSFPTERVQNYVIHILKNCTLFCNQDYTLSHLIKKIVKFQLCTSYQIKSTTFNFNLVTSFIIFRVLNIILIDN